MAKEKLPAIHLYPGDWLRDSISGCSLAAQGLWLRMMFVAHDAPKYGHIFASHLLHEKRAIARRCGCTDEEFDTLFSELKAAGVPGFEGDIVISRRMVRDASLRDVRAKAGRKGGKQNGKQKRSKTKAKPKQNPEDEIEDEDEDEDEIDTEIESEIPSSPKGESEGETREQQVAAVVAHYQTYHEKSRPGKKERGKILERLRDGFSVDDLKLAIDGCHVSPWHCGQNERGTLYQSLELIVRDSSKVTTFIEHASTRGDPQLSERSRRSLSAINSWLEKALGENHAQVS